MYVIAFTSRALDDLRFLRKNEQNTVVDAINSQLVADPLSPTRNRKPLRPNRLSQWELRVDQFRVFYDADADSLVVTIQAVGWKDHNKLYFRGQEFLL